MLDSDDDLEAGDVVCFEGITKVKKCSQDADNSVAGVVSTDPTITGSANTGKYPVGIVGLVPTKVSGPVDKFDLLTTSSISGFAKKASMDDFGAIIGKVLEPCDEEICMITALVSLS